jgi:hypothetical protein
VTGVVMAIGMVFGRKNPSDPKGTGATPLLGNFMHFIKNTRLPLLPDPDAGHENKIPRTICGSALHPLVKLQKRWHG